MLKNAYTKSISHDLRIYQMNLMKYCLERYKETKDEDYWEWARKFGEWSKYYKKEIEKLS